MLFTNDMLTKIHRILAVVYIQRRNSTIGYKASHIYIPTDSSENCRVLFCHDLFHLCWIRRRYNYCFGRVASWHSSVFRYRYSINRRNIIIKATAWLLLYYPLAKRCAYSIGNSCPSVRSFIRAFVRPFDHIDNNRKTKIIDSNRDTHIYRDRQTNW
jgi:hypothetical protein